MIDAGLSCVPDVDGSQTELPYRGSVQEHLHLLEISKHVVRELARASAIEKVTEPTLLHPDIHKKNILVSEEDPSSVTAIIDWQSTSIEPAFAYATTTPDLVEDPTADIRILENLMSKGQAPDAESLKETSVEDPEEEAAKKRHEKDVLVCQKTFEVVLRGYARKLHDARAMDETLLRPFGEVSTGMHPETRGQS